MATGMAEVVALDDDPTTCRLIETLLTNDGFSVRCFTDPQEAMQELQRKLPDLLLLDLLLPRTDGLALMRRLKAVYDHLPIILVTGRAELSDRVAGLEDGADDYITKPFEPSELTARVRAVLRRSSSPPSDGSSRGAVLTAGNVRLDMYNLTATTFAGYTADLTPTEARILYKLMSEPNSVVSREALRIHAIGRAVSSSKEIDVHISRIRAKLHSHSSPRCVVTVRGGGYMFRDPERMPMTATG